MQKQKEGTANEPRYLAEDGEQQPIGSKVGELCARLIVSDWKWDEASCAVLHRRLRWRRPTQDFVIVMGREARGGNMRRCLGAVHNSNSKTTEKHDARFKCESYTCCYTGCNVNILSEVKSERRTQDKTNKKKHEQQGSRSAFVVDRIGL